MTFLRSITLLIGVLFFSPVYAVVNNLTEELSLDSAQYRIDLIQQEIDTLLAKTKGALNIEQSDKLRHLLDEKLTLVQEYQPTKKTETLMSLGKVYRKINPRKAIDYFSQAYLATDTTNRFVRGNILSSIGITYNRLGEYDSAILFFEQSLQIREVDQDWEGVSISYNNLGTSYSRKGNLRLAIDCYIKDLNINNEKIKDDKGKSTSFANIGFLYFDLGDHRRSIEYLQKSIDIRLRLDLEERCVMLFDGLGDNYLYLGDFAASKKYYDKALKLWEKYGGQSFNKAQIYEGLSEWHSTQSDYEQAIFYALETDQLYTELNNVRGKLESQLTLGNLYLKQSKIYLAREYVEKAKVLIRQIHSEAKRADLIKLESLVLDAEGSYRQALSLMNEFYSLKDSLAGVEKVRQIQELQIQYKISEKEQENRLLKRETLLQEKLLNRQRFSIVVILIAAIILLISMIILRKHQRRTATLNRELKLKNHEINEVNAEVTQQAEELTQINTQLEENHQALSQAYTSIEDKNKRITESINYAKNIQRALLPSEEEITEVLGEHFIFYKPKDIVSGDVYWVHQGIGEIYWAMIDCTGHGVPGALMGMLAISAFNEAVKDKGITDLSSILEAVNLKVIQELRQQNNENNDGMEVALCKWIPSQRKLQFAGAREPLCLFRDGQVQLIKGDRRGLGAGNREIPFTLHEMILSQGDMVYTFSDGYQDQFGGEKEERFKMKRLTALLEKIGGLPLENQKIQLEEYHNQWLSGMQSPFQVDDILVMGIKISSSS
ncbi:tetratricopeptide repeat protein [Algivirga pacifica]|uniref:PPM-type phosphatase domain-containing protein n=1 Tax=Algivirga pacifica TaxID=1162670 RepID=A0ABP9DI11_9BACT